jgi:hypothetical protein
MEPREAVEHPGQDQAHELAGLGLTALEHRQLAQMRAARIAQTPESLTA